MKVVIFTSNAIRHRFVANSITRNVNDALIISECKKSDSIDTEDDAQSPIINEHFKLRYLTEKKIFSGNDYFSGKTLPLIYKEANLKSTFEIIKNFMPDLMLVFGSSILKEPLLSLVKPDRFINLHLGLSPYYRGSGTNFWPFVNKELQYVGSTILHIDEGIDTGDIIAHVRPKFQIGDDVHSVGCKVIKDSVSCILKIINLVKEGKEPQRVKQWKVENERYYRTVDFTEESLILYKKNLENQLIKNYLKRPKKSIRLIDLEL